MRITVKNYMTKPATPEFDFMAKWNNNNPMPLRTMVGEVVKETRGMVYMKLHGDIYAEKICVCMKCERPLTNPISQYFGIGPECGGHNYINPFDTEEELKEAVKSYRAQLQNITWSGWIIKSAIIDSEEDMQTKPKQGTKRVINIEVRNSVKNTYDNKSAFISFEYAEDIVDAIRQIPIRFYNAENKEWEIPVNSVDLLKLKINREITVFNEKGINILDKDKTVKIPANFKFKTEPFAHQIENIEYALNHNKWILGDEQGLGKSKAIIDYAVIQKQEKGFKHCLIICGVNGLKYNWQNEIKTHSDEIAYILGQRKNAVKGIAERLEDIRNLDKINAYFIITNIESLRNPAVITELNKRNDIDMIVVDEIHKCANPTSQQSKGLLKLSAEIKIAMTGTPLMNTPMDLYLPLKWLGYEQNAFYSFRNHYAIMGGFGGYQVMGYRNLDELQEKLSKVMIRHRKEDVLDLPEKLYIDEYVEMNNAQAKIYFEIQKAIKDDIDRIKISPDPLGQLIRLRQATGYPGILSSTVLDSAKLDRLIELADDAIGNGQKVVIFSNWTQMTDKINEVMSYKYKGIIITGQISTEQRALAINRFQNDDRYVYAVGTIGAMGTGITLTAGTVVIFVDEPWTKAAYDQAVDRCHRIGTTENITIYNLITKDTIDERVHEILTQKGELSDAIIDGNIKTQNKEALINFLLS